MVYPYITITKQIHVGIVFNARALAIVCTGQSKNDLDGSGVGRWNTRDAIRKQEENRYYADTSI